jgi:ATP-dependent helicase/nuclease subunit B
LTSSKSFWDDPCMPATVHVLCGPSLSGKTQRLMERFQDAVQRGQPGAAAWIVPNYRAIEAIRRRLFAEREAGWGHPLYTFQDFADEIVRCNDPRARPLSHAQRRLLADDIVAELHRRGGLGHFRGVIETRGFSDTVFGFLAELKQREIWPERFAEAVERAAQRDGGTDASRRKDSQCVQIYTAYQDLLIRHHLYDLEGRSWYARDLLGRGLRRPFDEVRFICLDGFTDFTHSQHEILRLLCSTLAELWITLPDEPGMERAELFARTRQTLARLQPLNPHVEYLPRNAYNGARSASKRSAGVAHIEKELFRPVKSVQRTAASDGIECLEAPGMVGEARMVARRIRTLLLEKVPPDDILVTKRDIGPYADLLQEVFADYGIPVDVEGVESLQRNPAVATLLRALRLPDEDWPFALVTALLRSGYFRPAWPETRDDPEIAQHSETLLRLLAEPRGREATLKAVDYWATHLPPGLEDEQADESRRKRTHELAKRCRGFLERFFQAWDTAPARGRLKEHVAWLRGFAADLGIAMAAPLTPAPLPPSAGGGGKERTLPSLLRHGPLSPLSPVLGGEGSGVRGRNGGARGAMSQPPDRDAAALERFWEELEYWVRVEEQLHDGGRIIDRSRFHRMLHALAAEAGQPRTPRGPGRVRVLSAPLVRGLHTPYVFVMGLGERSFPRLAPPQDLFDEQERQAFRQEGLDFPSVADLLPDEMLLFYQVVTGARRLILSYPAVDEKGQSLLPSSFLSTLRECFEPDAIPTERRNMLVERVDEDVPLSAAELRVRVARTAMGTPWDIPPVYPWPPDALPTDVRTNLEAAAEMVRHRFHAPDHGPYDGLLRDAGIIAEVAAVFGPERILSPTALENYIACPFKFFLSNVLRLEPLEEPNEEIESTDRGLAFHRALARFHARLREDGIAAPQAKIDRELVQQLEKAVAECASRASPAGQALWKLEGRRLQRVGERYRPHWQEFLEPWLPQGVRPQPAHFEVGFGLPASAGQSMAGPLVIADDGLEVRISGRIDRVDVAELPDGSVGFWIIDYKTGRGSNYTGAGLRDFSRLQLTLYALAAEEVVLADQRARPLGLAYWLVMEDGPKLVLPGSRKALAWLAAAEEWPVMRSALRRWVLELCKRIRGGQFALKPRDEKCSQNCDFSQICRITQTRSIVGKKSWQLELPQIS